ncbi:hypothetical protein AAHA92_21037 [Salvia divinorum]|uniref:Uncharacterized protein n=1 Tax=Salvia divinorum TaxID=28513 RepID=A0ABD1GJ54_SALDI
MKNFSKRFQEVWNKWVKDLPIAELVDSLRSKFMELYARRRDIGERLEGHTMLPIVVRHLNVLSRQLGHLKVKVGGRGEAEWPSMDLGFKVLPPLKKRAPGRQRENRILGCLEGKGNKSRTKGMWQVQCKQCKEFGHRESSAKCVFNGTKKRKSRAKGRPLGGMNGSACQGQRAVEEPMRYEELTVYNL